MMTKMPNQMRVMSARVGGNANSLLLEDRPLPVPMTGELLIKVAAAGVNRGDILQRERSYPAPPDTQYDVLGLEVSGTVVALGDDTGPFRVGDQVCALIKEGGYAEYALADVNLTLPVPEGVSLVDAAALPETCFTVWTNVFQRGRLRAGQSFLVHGGTSGIGVMAIQMAKAFGARVFATAGSDEKCAACLKLGADVAINYRDADFVAKVTDHTEGQGVDLILDMVAGSYLQRNLDALALEGTVVMIGLMEGMDTQFNIKNLLSRRLTITGSTLWARTPQQKSMIRQELHSKVWPMITSGTIQPVVHAIYPLEQAGQSHTEMEANRHIGKLLLSMEHE